MDELKIFCSMEQERQSVTPLDPVEVLQTSVQPSEQMAKGVDIYIREEDKHKGARPIPSKGYKKVNNGVLLMVRTGAIDTRNATFTATAATKEFFNHNWTARELKLMFILSCKHLPTYKKEVQEYAGELDKNKLRQMDKRGETFLNRLTETFVSTRELSLDLDASHGAETKMIKQTREELERVGAIETRYFFNCIINDNNISLERTGPLFRVDDVTLTINGKETKGVIVTYNNLWIYGWWAQVPDNFMELWNTYGNDTVMFLKLLPYFINVRGERTSKKNTEAAIQKKVAELRKNKVRKELWKPYLSDTVNRQHSQLFTQQGVLDVLGDGNKKRYIRNRKVKNKRHPERDDYTYENELNVNAFRKDLERTLDACVNIQVLTKARAFAIPKQQAKRDALVAELCKEFPGYTKEIERLTPAQGVCCLVTYNGKWTTEEKLPFAPAEDVTNDAVKS